MAKFNEKSFNPQAFKYLMERTPNLKMNEIRKSNAVRANNELLTLFKAQDGSAYARVAYKQGALDGTPVNYDGQTDITATTTKTFERGVVVIGRAKGWIEKDFSEDISGQDFMTTVAQQVSEYWDGIDQGMILSILKGIFSMTGGMNAKFVESHTYNVASVGDGMITATTLNSATNKACGANKKKFTTVFMHSDVATNLENLNLIAHLKYTDKDGVTRDLELGTWNGKLVMIDDDMPVEEVAATYAKTADTALDASKTYYTKSGSNYTAVASPDVANIGTYYEMTGDAHVEYTTYAMGDGAFDFADIGASVPLEMARNAATNGGETTLYTRQRKTFAPKGISYEKTSQASLSPTDAELETGANWCVVHSGETTEIQRSYYDIKAIPIARIISRG